MGRVGPLRVSHAVTVSRTVHHGQLLLGAEQSCKLGVTDHVTNYHAHFYWERWAADRARKTALLWLTRSSTTACPTARTRDRTCTTSPRSPHGTTLAICPTGATTISAACTTTALLGPPQSSFGPSLWKGQSRSHTFLLLSRILDTR